MAINLTHQITNNFKYLQIDIAHIHKQQHTNTHTHTHTYTHKHISELVLSGLSYKAWRKKVNFP